MKKAGQQAVHASARSAQEVFLRTDQQSGQLLDCAALLQEADAVGQSQRIGRSVQIMLIEALHLSAAIFQTVLDAHDHHETIDPPVQKAAPDSQARGIDRPSQQV